ncbi:hypothetical protein RN001_003451 [Aquatica leii]|uniref:Mutator-like transposase domain-containing protein n=1 Tax=Aquatica leii TaxID=1421715 RepID=A0AAN7QBQ0_9COLE|nr:hypothetical protein RN001_003451 [Aquatica leii]
MYLVSESRKGLESTFWLKCKMCNITHDIYSDNPTNDEINVNEAAVLGCISTGNGFSQMTETHAALNLPSLSNHKYLSVSTHIAEVIRNTAWECMKEAGEEEARLAKEVGDVDHQETPFITVIADGAWCKRSYKVNYNASSGVVSIFN